MKSTKDRNQIPGAKAPASRRKHGRDSEITGKERILKAAYSHFQTQSYANTRVDDICEAAGISKGAFYLHFESKEQMMEELFLQFFLQMQNDFRAFIESNPASPIAALELFRTSLEVTRGQLHMTRLFFESLGSRIASESEEINGFVGRIFDGFAQDLQKWMRLPASRKDVLRTLISSMDGIVLHWAFFQTSPARQKKQIDAFLEMVDHSTSGVLPDA
tara:strand:- start:61044 stop:61697 length:654 start_codon:yes stop_codon:yes gene_type:complete